MRGGARWWIGLAAIVAGVLGTAMPAAAHILITPSASLPGSTQLYTITVPEERPVPTVGVEVHVPAGVVVVSFAAAPGWQRQISVNGAGTVTAVTWSGGVILPGEYAQFGLYARNPDRAGSLVWPTTQIYQDGLRVAWTGATDSLQPAPITLLGGASASAGGVVPASSGTDTMAEVALAASLLALGLAALCLGLLILNLRRLLGPQA